MIKPRSRRTVAAAAAVAAIGILAVATYVVKTRRAGLPRVGTEAYEQTTTQFFRGLAEMQVGLLDVARQAFTQTTALAPGEPAAWANLGLVELRLGEFDAAAPPIEKAAQLAPRNSDIAFLQGRLETTRGHIEDGIAHLRRAVALDENNLRARTALVQEIENAGGPDADAEAQRVLEELVQRQPGNPAVLVERARLSAKRGDAGILQDSLRRMAGFAGSWPAESVEEYRAAEQAAGAGDFAGAARSIAFLRNTLARVPAFLEARRIVTPSAELIAEPFTAFLRLPAPVATPSAPDAALTFASLAGAAAAAGPADALAAFPLDGEGLPAVFAADSRAVYRVDSAGPVLPLPESFAGTALPAHGLLPVDWNNDFRMDLVAAGPRGVTLFVQGEDGTFADDTATASRVSGPLSIDATGAWAADIEMDGDLDIVLGVRDGSPAVLRNNGDGTWEVTHPFDAGAGLRAFAWGDVDGDGDPDAVLVDGRGELAILSNMQAGRFERLAGPAWRAPVEALALGDVDADGIIDLVTLDAAGAIQRSSFSGGRWTQDRVAVWEQGRAPGASRVFVADIDNNGAVDVIASGAAGSAMWLAAGGRTWQPLQVPAGFDVRTVADLTGDGQLDLAGVSGGRAVRMTGRGTRGYHYQVIRPRAQPGAGDQRINSFGIGGELEARSGLLVQKQIIDSPMVHVGLGTRTTVEVMRIVWPNGVLQADFDQGVDQAIVAQQRLKGSCPWVFADDGSGMRFVTDFLWRSPLGLRINAVDTAGVTQTEDRVKIRGDQLVARNGAYDVRITAELWETHYIDAVSLLAIDHPKDVAVFVDERFAREAPDLDAHAMRLPRPVAKAWDQAGRDVTDVVSTNDGRYLDTFARGRYQGIAEDHFVEIDLGEPIRRGTQTWLVAHGWIYPTDSSINVAIAQGGAVKPRGLSLEAQDGRGRWIVVAPDLGFPAGKNKTILVDLGRVERAGVAGARRLRLRTNLEIYWDSIATAEGVPDASFKTVRLDPARAELRYRGFSETRLDSRTRPEIPLYDRIANTVPRWRDLTGYYTRFGDVRELLAAVEDRYVIMNAGDELRLSFPALPPPAPGWTRDFVLAGDGWEKDGDYNTSFSSTVLPLPSHDYPMQGESGGAPSLERDPVYRRHSGDWATFHTRFVTPRAFLGGLQPTDRRQP
jgi:tetratricopeptide (TPR) repeat protein